MVDSGESITTIQSLTGHSTPRVLMGYAHKVSKSVKEAVKKRQTKLQKIIGSKLVQPQKLIGSEISIGTKIGTTEFHPHIKRFYKGHKPL